MGFPINEKLAEGIVILSTATYSSVTAAASSAAVDLSQCRKVQAIFTAGGLAGGETITCSLQGCATVGGSYVAIAGASATLTKANNDDTKSIVLEVSAESVNDLGLGYRFVKAVVSGAVGSPVSVVVIGGGGPEEPIGFTSQLASNIKTVVVI